MKIHQIPHITFETTGHFFFKLCITLQCNERQLFCTFLAGTLYDLDKRSPSKCKMPDFRLLMWNFTKFVIWSAPFVESIYNFSKKVQRSYVPWQWTVMQNLKKNRSVSKMTRIWCILIWALKSHKNLHFDWSFRANYITFHLKSTEELSFMTLTSHAKFEEKLTCALENDMRNLAIFTRTLDSIKIGTLVG